MNARNSDAASPEAVTHLPPLPDSIEQVSGRLADLRYVTDRALATAIFLAMRLPKPLLLEGEAGVGKTEVAKVLATATGGRLIRLQCYEGLDINQAVYEWNYSRQMLHIRLLEAQGSARDGRLEDLFSPEFLVRRPLLQALETGDDASPPVLLVDEIDRADDELDAFLLEMLADYQVTVPEIGTIRADRPPHVVITSNRTRELHDALKRRCLYHWIEYPTFEKELRIVAARVPNIADTLARQITAFVQALRQEELYKVPGIAETLDWAGALVELGVRSVGYDDADATLGALVKHQEDMAHVRGQRLKNLLDTAAES
ncbi:MAG: ATPase [Dehalococcoidia bacterium]|nr:ATPase [Dehalococcoidia bacterium]